jgi:hypothetical protein
MGEGSIGLGDIAWAKWLKFPALARSIGEFHDLDRVYDFIIITFHFDDTVN